MIRILNFRISETCKLTKKYFLILFLPFKYGWLKIAQQHNTRQNKDVNINK